MNARVSPQRELASYLGISLGSTHYALWKEIEDLRAEIEAAEVQTSTGTSRSKM